MEHVMLRELTKQSIYGLFNNYVNKAQKIYWHGWVRVKSKIRLSQAKLNLGLGLSLEIFRKLLPVKNSGEE